MASHHGRVQPLRQKSRSERHDLRIKVLRIKSELAHQQAQRLRYEGDERTRLLLLCEIGVLEQELKIAQGRLNRYRQ